MCRPDGWTQKKDAPVVLVRLLKTDAVGKIAISATRMPLEFNDWNKNVTQWAGDIGAKTTPDEIGNLTQNIQVDGAEAQQITLSSPESESREALVGVMFEKQGYTWFVKMKGDSEIVKKAESDLNAFLKSIKIK